MYIHNIPHETCIQFCCTSLFFVCLFCCCCCCFWLSYRISWIHVICLPTIFFQGCFPSAGAIIRWPWWQGSDPGGFGSLRWRHNDNDGVSNHQPHGCLLNRLFGSRSKKTSKLRVTGLCAGKLPGPVNSPHKGPVTLKMFPFDDVIMVKSFSAKSKQPMNKHAPRTYWWLSVRL